MLKALKRYRDESGEPERAVASQIGINQHILSRWDRRRALITGFTPEINHPDVQANATSWSPARQPDSARVIRPKISNVRYRTFVRHRILDVKLRLIALWHQSLMLSERSRGWNLFSNLEQMAKKENQLHRRDDPLMRL